MAGKDGVEDLTRDASYDQDKMSIRIGVPATWLVACSDLVVQIDCEQGNYCLGYTYVNHYGTNTNAWAFLHYLQV